MSHILNIRRASPAEAPALTEIAHEAKRHWGYPEEWIELWRNALTLTRGYLINHEVFVGEYENQIVGFYALTPAETAWELDHLWIRPVFMGRGFGRAMLDHAVGQVRTLSPGCDLVIESDPNAEQFYLKMGAERAGEVSKNWQGVQRTLPLLRFRAEVS